MNLPKSSDLQSNSIAAETSGVRHIISGYYRPAGLRGFSVGYLDPIGTDMYHGTAYVARAESEDLASLGLSRPKNSYAHALSQSVLDYDGLARLQDESVLSALTQVTGIGYWTAEVYALQALGRADVFPHGDLALQEAARLVFHLST